MMNDLTKSLATQEKAKNLIAGFNHLLSKRPDQFSLGVWPGYYEKAEGAHVWDLDGNQYLDMSIGGIGANILGYADPDVNAAVIQSINRGSSSTLNCPEEVELAELFIELHPWADMARFTRSGGEAMAVAVRLVRAATGKDKILFCGYHGWHDWYLAANLATDTALDGHLLPGLSPKGVPRGLKESAFPFNYNNLNEFNDLIAKHGGQTAAVVMEPIRNMKPHNGFLESIRDICSKTGTPLVFDEISSGFRLCNGGAHLSLGVNPDVAVFSKSIGNGFPIAAIIGKRSVLQVCAETFISSTNWTERTGPTAALATIKKFVTLNVSEHLNKIGQSIQDGWRKISERTKLAIHVDGIYPLGHFGFEDHALATTMKAYFVQGMLDRKILASNLFYAMLAHNHGHVEQYLSSAEEVFTSMKSAYDKGSLKDQLRGKPAVAGFKRLT